MRTMLFHACMLLLIVASGCAGSGESSLQRFIPGTYSRVIDHEFATGMDTVLIEHRGDNRYVMTKRSSFQRKLDGRLLNWQYEENLYTGLYDQKEKILYEQKEGKQYTFSERQRKLWIGGSEYDKVIK